MTEEEYDAKIRKIIHTLYMNGETLTGSDAAIFLASVFASGTHGAYDGKTLWEYTRAEEKYEMTVKLKTSEVMDDKRRNDKSRRSMAE